MGQYEIISACTDRFVFGLMTLHSAERWNLGRWVNRGWRKCWHPCEFFFFKLLRRFSLSFSALSFSALSICASLEWLHDSKESYSWQVLPSLSARAAFPALACSSLSGAPLPHSLPFFLYFLAFSLFSSILTIFPACLFAPLIQFLPQFPHIF